MDARTLEALKASIAKWERNAVAERAFDYLTTATDCPLCRLFFHNGCLGCPVFDHTEEDCCNSTPYEAAADAAVDWEYHNDRDLPSETARDKAHAAARAEVAFLKSLLPPEEAQ